MVFPFSVSYEYASSTAHLSWHDILFAIDHSLLAKSAAIEHAVEELRAVDDSSDSLMELAWLGESDAIRVHVEELARQERGSDHQTTEKWLYIVLSWVYENRDHFDDPLEAVELVYANFDYPPCIESFVRYTPSEEASLGGIEENTKRLYRNWETYLSVQSQEQAGLRE